MTTLQDKILSALSKTWVYKSWSIANKINEATAIVRHELMNMEKDELVRFIPCWDYAEISNERAAELEAEGKNPTRGWLLA